MVFSAAIFWTINSKSIKNLKRICGYLYTLSSCRLYKHTYMYYQTRTRVSISCAKLSIMEFYIFGQSSSQLCHFTPKRTDCSFLHLRLTTVFRPAQFLALRVVWDFEDIVKTKNTDIHVLINIQRCSICIYFIPLNCKKPLASDRL